MRKLLLASAALAGLFGSALAPDAFADSLLPNAADWELSSQLENVGVTMPAWFAGGS